MVVVPPHLPIGVSGHTKMCVHGCMYVAVHLRVHMIALYHQRLTQRHYKFVY